MSMISRLQVRRVVLLVATFLFFILLTPGLARASSTEYTIPTTGSHPMGATQGPDGAVWFTENNASKIGRVSSGGTLSEYYLGSSYGPKYITAGPDGNLWFTTGAGKIGVMTASGTVTLYAVSYDSFCGTNSGDKIIAGPDGNLWFAEGYCIGTITPSGTITQHHVGYNVTSLNSGPDGNIWFVTSGWYTGYMTTSGTVSAANISGLQSNDITTGPDGNMWITNMAGNSIVKLTTSRTTTAYSIPTSSSQPQSITAGPDGALWFTEYSGNKVGRITTTGSLTEYSTPTASAGDWGIASDSDGNVWYTEYSGNKVVRLGL